MQFERKSERSRNKMILKNSETGQGKSGLAEISVDDLIHKNINMEITVENMEEE